MELVRAGDLQRKVSKMLMWYFCFYIDKPVVFAQDGDSALMVAVKYCHTNVVLELVKAGANLDIQNKVRNYQYL